MSSIVYDATGQSPEEIAEGVIAHSAANAVRRGVGRSPINDLIAGIDKLHEAQQLVELINLAGNHDETTEPFAVAAVRASDLLTDALARLKAVASALKGEGGAA